MRATCISLLLAMIAGASACGPSKPAETPANADEASPPAASHTESEPPPGVAATPPAATPPPSSGVPYDKEAVEISLKRAARQVKANCGATTDEDGKASGPWGKTTVTVKLGHNGHSQGATVSAPFDGRPVGKCIAQAFVVMIYPPFAGPDTTVDWPVEVIEPAAPVVPAASSHH